MRAITLISGQALHDAQMRLPIRSSSSSHGIRIDRPFFQPVFRVKPPVLPALNTQFTACTASACGDHDLCPFHTARPDATKSYCRVAWRWHRRCEGVPTVPIIADRKLENWTRRKVNICAVQNSMDTANAMRREWSGGRLFRLQVNHL